MRIFFHFIVAIFFSLRISGQQYVADSLSIIENDSIPLNIDKNYSDQIKTVLLRPAGSDTYKPIINLDQNSKLLLTFEDLQDDFTEYRFELQHCDKDWNIIDQSMTDFYRPAFNNLINEYGFSKTTRTGFVRYELTIPGNEESFRQSGNYLVHIKNNETDELVLTRRFMVLDSRVTVTGQVVRTDDVQFSDYRQQVKFQIYDTRAWIKDVGQIYPRIHKNDSWDIACDKLKPSFVMDNVLTYDRTDKCYFEGGNEYRNFNMIDFRNISNNIVRVNHQANPYSKIWLDVDKPRSFLKYSTIVDKNGRIRYTGDFKAFDPLELDYAEVTFTLKTDDIMMGYEIYLYGQLSNFQLQEDLKMLYNADNGKYELTHLLKQGLYEYQYVVRSPYQEGPDEGTIEGSHFTTENEYTILVYYRNVFEGYDQLIGVEKIKSGQKIETLFKNN